MTSTRNVHRTVSFIPATLAGIALAASAPAAVERNELARALDIANAVRASGCADQPGIEKTFRPVPALSAAAERIARGATLEGGLDAAKYRASTATLVHIEARPGSGAVEKFLNAKFCATVTDPELTEAGQAHREGEVWLVLATPLAVPRTEGASDVRERVLELVNLARGEPRQCGAQRFGAVVPLLASELLDTAATAHAEDMAARDELSHLGSDGSTVRERVTRTGYAWLAVGENVAEGQPDADSVVRDWLASPEHCATLMDPADREMGIAYAISSEGMAHAYWAQVFAAHPVE
jgi:uncharacterized protein YkwD